jgi:hypothetical protein
MVCFLASVMLNDVVETLLGDLSMEFSVHTYDRSQATSPNTGHYLDAEEAITCGLS